METKLIVAIGGFIVGFVLEAFGIKYTTRRFWAIIILYALIALSIINRM